MEKKNIYIDESGDTGYTKKSTRYFILTAVIVEDGLILERIVKKIHKTKLDKNKGGILHAYKESVFTKNRFVNKLFDFNVRCFVFVLDKNNKYVDDVYLYSLKNVLKYCIKNNFNSIVIARKDIRKFYNKNIIDMFWQNNIKMNFSIHEKDKALQAADFYSWIIFVYLEKGESFYFDKLKHLITFI
jgi:hypothetical protein